MRSRELDPGQNTPVLRLAVAARAYAFVLAHNHPTGVPDSSHERPI